MEKIEGKVNFKKIGLKYLSVLGTVSLVLIPVAVQSIAEVRNSQMMLKAQTEVKIFEEYIKKSNNMLTMARKIEDSVRQSKDKINISNKIDLSGTDGLFFKVDPFDNIKLENHGFGNLQEETKTEIYYYEELLRESYEKNDVNKEKQLSYAVSYRNCWLSYTEVLNQEFSYFLNDKTKKVSVFEYYFK